jgi:hypothetical protein
MNVARALSEAEVGGQQSVVGVRIWLGSPF